MPGALREAGLQTRMLLQVHDELVFEAPAEEADAALPVIRRVMETAAEPAVALSVPLTVDARAAGNWEPRRLLAAPGAASYLATNRFAASTSLSTVSPSPL